MGNCCGDGQTSDKEINIIGKITDNSTTEQFLTMIAKQCNKDPSAIVAAVAYLKKENVHLVGDMK